MRTFSARACTRLLPLFLAIALLLAACSTSQNAATIAAPTSSAATPTVANIPTSATSPTSPAPTTTPTASPTTAAPSPTGGTPSARPTTGAVPTSPSATPGAATAADVTAAIQAVIQRANDEQQRALAAHDPTLMRDTATAVYYATLVQTNQDLAANGVTDIALVKLDWGPIAQQTPTSATATTFETWRTTYADGSTAQSRDQNIYSLVLEGSAWKVQADDHPGQPTTGGTGGGTASPLPAAPTGPGQSNNWSGYNATGGTFTAVSGSWTVPQVTAASGSGADATWVGIGGVTSHDLIQAGTDATVAGGRVRYTAWVEMLPQSSQQVPLVVSPGDQISVAITQQADGTWLIAFQNRTTGKSYQVTETYASSRSSAEWVEEAPSSGRRVVPLDDFGTVQFQAASAVKDGQQISIAQAGGTTVTMINRSGEILAAPSPLGADGASFTVQRSAVMPTSPAPVAPGRGRPTPTT